MALILSLLTSLVSPQFHVRADTQFQTLRKAFDNRYPKLQWQDKCHFTQEDAQAKQQMQDEDMPPPEGAQILPNELQGTANDSASQDETQETMSGLVIAASYCSSTARLLHASTKQSSPRDTARHDRTSSISETMMPNATLH